MIHKLSMHYGFAGKIAGNTRQLVIPAKAGIQGPP
jgi:hypothetical protein